MQQALHVVLWDRQQVEIPESRHPRAAGGGRYASFARACYAGQSAGLLLW